MIVLDSLIVGGIKFVLGKLATAVDTEMNDDTLLREDLLAAQMKVELGEMTETEFAEVEKDLLARIREVRERRTGRPAGPGAFKVTGVETAFDTDEEEPR